jgi:hypothetical protein
MFKLFKKKDVVLDKFTTELNKQGLQIKSIDEEGLIYISKGDFEITISLENTRRNYLRDADDSHISGLVDSITSFSTNILTWEDVKESVYMSLFPNDFDFNECLNFRISEEISKIYIRSFDNKFAWITNEDLETWGISEQDLDVQANQNANILLKESTIPFEEIEGRKLGMIENEHDTLKSALLFASDMEEKIKEDFGFPFYAVIPVRDFCYIFSEENFDFFASRLGKTVVEEYRASGYPITTEILRFSEKGAEAVGKYPLE